MKWTRLVPILLVASLALPWSGNAQEIAWTSRQLPQGWIGFYYDFAMGMVDGEEKLVVVVTEVVEGSPAETAGIRVGDTLIGLDGHPISQKVFSSLSQTLEPRDLIRLTVNRDGRPREVLVEAGERPRSQIVIGPDAERVVVQLEALSGNILRELDSLRLSFAGLRLDSTSGDLSLQILRVPTVTEEEGKIGFRFRLYEPFVDTLVFEPDVFFMAPEFTMPFEAMIVKSRATASLQEELGRLRKELTAIRRQELARRRELAAAIQGPIEEVVRRDDRIREIRAREAELVAEQGELTTRLRRVSEEEMQRQWVEVQARSEETLREQESMRDRARDSYEALAGRIRSPIIVGQNIMLGAQLAPLNPELAEYFPVDEGVFVIQVMEGTPAFDAGLQGGDIIISVAGEEVISLSDLRFGLGVFDGPLRIQVIRKGEPVEVLIRR
jgi:hypothetical protein